MVYLASIPNDDAISGGVSVPTEQLKAAQLGESSLEDDCFTTTVYASRFAAQDLPKHEMPETEMPKEVAYRLIKDDLSLDGNPMLK
jgi:glutamate decarboxylase